MTLPDFSGQCAGQYRLTLPLSDGSTSAVYCAVDTQRPGRYAVKCIPKSDLTPKQLLSRTSEVFHHQLVTGCSIHVLPLVEIVDEDWYLFIVFKLCEGDLYHAIWHLQLYQRNDALIKKTFLDIVDGVYACHTKGVFHRDLKPENILCAKDGTDIRIADFGLATRKRVCKGSRCGTPDYMSPEQWSGDHIIYYPGLSDIWSLGIILVNLVTARRPWQTARSSNAHFRTFLEDKDYLYNTYPISRTLNQVLRWILRPNPFDCPQMLQIRQVILNVDTFYREPGRPSLDATVEWSKRMALIQQGYFPDLNDEEATQFRCGPM